MLLSFFFFFFFQSLSTVCFCFFILLVSHVQISVCVHNMNNFSFRKSIFGGWRDFVVRQRPKFKSHSSHMVYWYTSSNSTFNRRSRWIQQLWYATCTIVAISELFGSVQAVKITHLRIFVKNDCVRFRKKNHGVG